MSYQVRLRPAAERDLRGLSSSVQARLMDHLAALSSDPRPAGSQELRGDLRGLRRLRIGQYRVGHRSTFYKQLKR